jgi:hypothetical protein
MSLLSNALSITPRDSRDARLCDILGLTAPGGYAMREADGRIMVWANEADSIDDDGARAIFRSARPESAAVWAAVSGLSWIDESEEA